MNRSKKQTIYFAHPMSMYGTAEEAAIVKAFEDIGFNVINPGDPAVGMAFANYRNGNPNNYMQFFVDLCNNCDMAIFCTFPDNVSADGVPHVANRVGAGVVTEIESFWQRGAPTFWVNLALPMMMDLVPIKDWDLFTTLDVPQTRAMLKAINPDYRSGKL